MPSDEMILALYLSTDSVIYAAAPLDDRNLGENYENPPILSRQTYRFRKGQRPSPREALAECARIFLALREKGCSFSHVNIAAPSPFVSLDRFGSDYRSWKKKKAKDQTNPNYGIVAYNPRLTDWVNINVPRRFQSLIEAHENREKPSVLVSSYQASFAAGEYFTRYWSSIEDAPVWKGLGEYKNGNSLLYISLDVGVSCSLIYHGTPYRNRNQMPPEIEHIPMMRHSADSFAPAHCEQGHVHDCVEGLLTFGAIEARWGLSVHDFLTLDRYSPYLWMAGYYASQLLLTLHSTYNPTRIVVGGRMVKHPSFLSVARKLSFEALMHCESEQLYPGPHSRISWQAHITPPARKNSGVRGLLYLAHRHVVEDKTQAEGGENVIWLAQR